MFFLLQRESGKDYNAVESAIIEDLLHSCKGIHEYVTMKTSDFYSEVDSFDIDYKPQLKDKSEFDSKYQDAIAIGEIRFVEKVLKIFHNIEHENSIEIPPCLREERFLKRKYSIVPVWEIPRKGRYFIKDASQQKVFSYNGELSDFIYDEMFEDPSYSSDASLRFNYDHLYQVSESVQVLSEYRVYVLGGKVETISHFAGDPYQLPDIELIKEAVSIYNKQENAPRSYSVDLMVTPRGTAITEVHNFMC